MAVFTVVLGVFGAGTARAVDKTLTWEGAFPIIGTQSVKSVVHVDVPAKAAPGQTVSVPFSIDVDAGTAAADGLRLVGVTKLGGKIDAKVNVTASGGKVDPVRVTLDIPETKVPEQGGLTFTANGTVDFTVSAGTPAGPAKSAVDKEAVSHITTDAKDPSLAKFDVNLTLSPPEQDTVLGTTEVG
ncbi:DUF6801 domain-containing protein [Amycolatopsis sp. CA-230715]|uniref:DUF6801 domain-containing protein n=1 Tax=Amycolatopsis sp. CA-230715 TaxID=2745196 RepID=UPI001C3226AB|nr:DUF6801 domain-containing protein [Amycolatopsis sp. CA-230715]QWF84060.1 hypothetical protein HUW46_07504 [Amycolatopsis sp. CA-230715]